MNFKLNLIKPCLVNCHQLNAPRHRPQRREETRPCRLLRKDKPWPCDKQAGERNWAVVFRPSWQMRWEVPLKGKCLRSPSIHDKAERKPGSFICNSCCHWSAHGTTSSGCQLLDLCVQLSDDPLHRLSTLTHQHSVYKHEVKQSRAELKKL